MPSEHDNRLHAQPEPRGDASAVREPATQEQQVTVVATSLKLRNWRQLPRFLRVNGQVARQLKAAPGNIKFSLDADFIRLRFSTLSVWKNDQTMEAFVRSGSHREAMAAFDTIAVRSESGFLRWKALDLEGATWAEAGRRLAEQGIPHSVKAKRASRRV